MLINNAGMASPAPNQQPEAEMDFDGWAETFAVNTMAPLRVLQAFRDNLQARVTLAAGSLFAMPCFAEPATQDQIADTLQAPEAVMGHIEARADWILRRMGEYLGSAREFRFRANITYEQVMYTGQKIFFGGGAVVSLQRPNRLHAYYEGDGRGGPHKTT